LKTLLKNKKNLPPKKQVIIRRVFNVDTHNYLYDYDENISLIMKKYNCNRICAENIENHEEIIKE
jgi:hypothetical protein